ncbi:histone-lysine N-methyltransferase SETMAR [Trichonephila clavipes]|nr:histone-lysine N-methyltransferase SETMAR [Trichonephila clavipes]
MPGRTVMRHVVVVHSAFGAAIVCNSSGFRFLEGPSRDSLFLPVPLPSQLRIRPQYAQKISCHDNVCPYAANIKLFLAKKGGGQIEHPPYSPDLSPSAFFLFPRLILALEGKRLDDFPDIQRNVTRLLNSTQKEDFLQSFQDMCSRSQRCIVMGCDCFEEQYGNFH